MLIFIICRFLYSLPVLYRGLWLVAQGRCSPVNLFRRCLCRRIRIQRITSAHCSIFGVTCQTGPPECILGSSPHRPSSTPFTADEHGHPIFAYFRLFSPFFALFNALSLLFCFRHHWIIYCHDAQASTTYSHHFTTLCDSYLLLVIFAFFDISSPMVAFLIYLMQHLIWCRIPFIYLLFIV